MRLSSYEAAKELILAEQEIASFVGPQPSNLLEQIEKVLGLEIIGSYRSFLERLVRESLQVLKFWVFPVMISRFLPC